MEKETLLTSDDQGQLFLIYEKATTKLFEIWKTEFLLAYESNFEKEEYADEILSFVKNIIFNRVNNSQKDFARFDFEPIKKHQFYVHLAAFKTGKKINYCFMNREIDGKKIDPFEGEDIPEVYAGAFWKYYQYLVKGSYLNSKNSENVITNLSIEETAYLCYYNKVEVTHQNCNEIVKYYGNNSGLALKHTLDNFKKNRLGSGTASTVKLNENKIKRYEKIIPLISNEKGKLEATHVLKELIENFELAKKNGTLNESND